MPFKIADAFVAVMPQDDGFEAELRRQITDAAEGVDAKVGIGLKDGAAEELRAKLEAAVLEASEGLSAGASSGAGGGVAGQASEVESFWADAFAQDLHADAEQMGGDFAGDFGQSAKDEMAEQISALSQLSQGQYDKIKIDPDNVVQAFSSGTARKAAEDLQKEFESGLLEEGPPDVLLPNGKWASEMSRDAGSVGTAVAEQMNVMIQAGMHDDAMALGESFNQMLVPAAEKGGKNAGDAAGGAMSPLIIAAIGGVAAIGAPLLLAGIGGAFVGIAALALKSNKAIAADYTTLASDAETTVKQAAAPIAGSLNQALLGLDGTVKGLEPELAGLFSNVAPDIQSVAGGVSSLVSGVLPGLSSALGSSQVIVTDFGDSMGPLGSGTGSFFTGLTRDATTTGAGLQSVFGVLGNTVSTLGTVLGSASTAISADLMAIDPAINGVLAGVRGLSNPETIGALGGAFGAWKLGGPIQSGLQSVSTGFLNVASKAEGAGGLVGAAGSLAEKASGGFGTMAEVMGGPWGIAIGAGVGLLSGLAGILFESSHASDALTVSSQDLATAISKDGGQVGQNTAAYIAQQDAANGLSKAAANAGVSLETYTQAVVGNQGAQEQVTASVQTYNQIVQNQAVATSAASYSASKYTAERTAGADSNAAANNRLTAANQQLLASMNAQNGEITAAITKQTELTEVTNTLNNVQMIFQASLKSGYQQMIASSQASAMTSVAALNLGDVNYGLNQSLYQSVTAYNNAQTAGNAYTAVLNAESGTINSLLGSEAAFTTSLSGVAAAVKANGTSLDVNTTKGAANITTLTGIATAADKAAGAVYDNEVATKGSAQAYDDANNKLAQEKEAFIAAADKAGMNKVAVQQLANELFQLPKNVSVVTNLDTGPAYTNLTELLKTINTSSGTVKVYANDAGTVGSTQGGPKAHAAGGPAGIGQAYTIGDSGRPEVFVAPADGYIYPSVAQGQKAIDAHNAAVTGAGAKSTPPGNQTTVHQNFFGPQLPNGEQSAQMRRELASAGAF